MDAGIAIFLSDTPPLRPLRHPAVALRQVDNRIFVIYGTSKPRDLDGKSLSGVPLPDAPNASVFWVDPWTPSGKSIGITKRTFFSRGTIKPMYLPFRADNDFIVRGTCLPNLFFALQDIAGIRRP